MDNWKETTLGKIAKNVSRRFDFSNKEKVVFVNTGDVQEGKFLHKNYSKSEGLPGQAKKALKKGDILLSEIRPANNRYALVDFETEDYVVSTKFMVISGNELVDPRFLYLFLTSRQTLQEFQVIAESRSGTFPQITFDSIANFPISLPSLPEQKQIAAALSSLDDKIELLRKQNETLEKIAQGIFKEWFVNFTIDGKKLKLKNGVPEGWRTGKIKDLIKILSGFAFKSEDFLSEGRYKLVTIKNVQDGFFEKVTKDRLQEIPSKMPEYCHLKTGDILLSLTGNVGRICHVVGDDYLLNQRVAKLSSVNKKDFAFAYLFFRQKEIFNLLGNISSGTAQQNLSPVQTGNLEAVIPERKVLDNFAEVSNPMFEKIFNNLSQIQTLSRLRDTLLPKLMSGEINIRI